MPAIPTRKPNLLLILILLASVPACQTGLQSPAKKGAGRAIIPSGENSPGSELETETTGAYQDPGGTLGLRELTEMAIARSPEVAGAEGAIRVAQAERRNVWQIEDPEIRTRFGWDDVRISQVGQDNIRRGEDVDIQVRFYPPNPWEMRARLRKSLANERYSHFNFRQVTRDIVLAVRRMYQELQYLQEAMTLSEGAVQLDEGEAERMDQLLREGMITRRTVDRARMRALGKRGNATSDRLKLRAARSELAAMVGLDDSARIRIEGVPDRRRVGFNDVAIATLIEFAYLNSPELGELEQAEADAQGDLDAFSAKKIPWVGFLEIGDDMAFRDHDLLNNAWSVRMALSLPFFSWTSKEAEIYKEQIASAREQALRERKRIEQRLMTAISHVKTTEEALVQFDRESDEIMGGLEDWDKENPETVYMINGHVLDRRRSRLDLEEAYHEALLDLEEVIRGDIEELFDTKRTNPETEPAG